MSEDSVITSPDGSKYVALDYQGEVRFGPALFHGTSSGFAWPLGTAVIGQDVHWSADSRYVVVLVFKSTDTAKPPDVELCVIDTMNGTVLSIARNRQGLISQHGFQAGGEYEYALIQHGDALVGSWTPVR